jgi:hypothetical protein
LSEPKNEKYLHQYLIYSSSLTAKSEDIRDSTQVSFHNSTHKYKTQLHENLINLQREKNQINPLCAAFSKKLIVAWLVKELPNFTKQEEV